VDAFIFFFFAYLGVAEKACVLSRVFVTFLFIRVLLFLFEDQKKCLLPIDLFLFSVSPSQMLLPTKPLNWT
jgi:hypothetical protein